MSQQRYGPAPSTGVWRPVVVVLVTLGGLPAGLFAGFAALVTWSGCFIGCSTPNHRDGALLGLLAVALLLAGPVLAWVLIRRWSAVGWAVLGQLAALAALVLPNLA